MRFFNDYCSPLNSFEQVFNFVYLFIETKDRDNFNSLVEFFNYQYDTNLSVMQVNCLAEKLKLFLGINFHSLILNYNNLSDKVKSLKKIIRPPLSNCLRCNRVLSRKVFKNTLTYYIDGPKETIQEILDCRICRIEYKYDKYSEDDIYMTYPNSCETSIFYLSDYLSFDIGLIFNLNHHILRNGVTFEGYADVYNEKILNDKYKLNRKRLSEAFFSYNIKRLYHNSLDGLQDINPKNTEEVLENLLPSFSLKFSREWSKIHDSSCLIKNCSGTGTFLVKNHQCIDLYII